MEYIYKVTNKINNKIYIGQTVFSLEERWYRHQIKAKLNKTNNKFYNARTLVLQRLTLIAAQKNREI